MPAVHSTNGGDRKWQPRRTHPPKAEDIGTLEAMPCVPHRKPLPHRYDRDRPSVSFRSRIGRHPKYPESPGRIHKRPEYYHHSVLGNWDATNATVVECTIPQRQSDHRPVDSPQTTCGVQSITGTATMTTRTRIMATNNCKTTTVARNHPRTKSPSPWKLPQANHTLHVHHGDQYSS